jgi:hypothetical protein
VGKIREELWPWTEQPSSAANPRSEHGLLGAWIPGLGDVSRQRVGVDQYSSNAVSINGRAYGTANGYQEFIDLATSSAWMPVSGGFSMLVFMQYGSAIGDAGVGVRAFSIDASNILALYVGVSGNAYFDFGGVSEGSTRTSGAVDTSAGAVACYVGTTGPRGMELWRNGRLVNSNGANPTRTVTTDRPFAAGDLYLGTAGNHRYACIAAWGQQLPISLAQQLSSNPWQLFEPRRIYIPYAAAAGGLPTLSAATYVPGSLTSTGFRPRATATY